MSWWFLAVATVWVAIAPEDSDLDKARSAYWDGDYAAALAGFEPLAVSGNPTATRYIGYMYLRGDGVRKDPTKAVALFRRAAERGDLLSVFSLGGLFAEGLGVEKNEQEAVKLYTRAAKAGLANAQLNLGSMYRFGVGMP